MISHFHEADPPIADHNKESEIGSAKNLLVFIKRIRRSKMNIAEIEKK